MCSICFGSKDLLKMRLDVKNRWIYQPCWVSGISYIRLYFFAHEGESDVRWSCSKKCFLLVNLQLMIQKSRAPVDMDNIIPVFIWVLYTFSVCWMPDLPSPSTRSDSHGNLAPSTLLCGSTVFKYVVSVGATKKMASVCKNWAALTTDLDWFHGVYQSAEW